MSQKTGLYLHCFVEANDRWDTTGNWADKINSSTAEWRFIWYEYATLSQTKLNKRILRAPLASWWSDTVRFVFVGERWSVLNRCFLWFRWIETHLLSNLIFRKFWRVNQINLALNNCSCSSNGFIKDAAIGLSIVWWCRMSEKPRDIPMQKQKNLLGRISDRCRVYIDGEFAILIH